MTRLGALLTISVVFCMNSPVEAKDVIEKFTSFDKKTQTYYLRALRPVRERLEELGLKDTNDIVVYGGTANCPGNCNDDYIGGTCYCGEEEDPETGETECPEGTEENDDENPTEGRECETKPKEIGVGGGGMSSPLTVQMP